MQHRAKGCENWFPLAKFPEIFHKLLKQIQQEQKGIKIVFPHANSQRTKEIQQKQKDIKFGLLLQIPRKFSQITKGNTGKAKGYQIDFSHSNSQKNFHKLLKQIQQEQKGT